MTNVIGRSALLIRETLGWSREQLAKASSVPVSAVYLLERLGWEGTPDDRQISGALEAAAARRLEAVAVLNPLIAAGIAGRDHRVSNNNNQQEQPICDTEEQLGFSTSTQRSLDFTIQK